MPRKRWPLVLLAVLLISVLVGVAATVLSDRRIEGAVPGKAPILSLAARPGGFLVGTTNALYRSADGLGWSKIPGFDDRTLVAGGGDRWFAFSGSELTEVPLQNRRNVSRSVPLVGKDNVLSRAPTSLAEGAGALYVGGPGPSLLEITEATLGGDSPEVARLKVKGPREMLALDVAPQEPRILFAGGLTSGLWRSTSEDNWTQILKTSARAVLVDNMDPKRIYLATAGGVLISRNQGLSWDFTQMRLSVEALAQEGTSVFAVTQDRLIYKSAQGLGPWKALAIDQASKTEQP